jgi:hypothetical protein
MEIASECRVIYYVGSDNGTSFSNVQVFWSTFCQIYTNCVRDVYRRQQLYNAQFQLGNPMAICWNVSLKNGIKSVVS